MIFIEVVPPKNKKRSVKLIGDLYKKGIRFSCSLNDGNDDHEFYKFHYNGDSSIDKSLIWLSIKYMTKIKKMY